MSASRTIQAASIFYLDNLLATAPALYTSSCLLFWLHFSTSTFSPITIFWICRIQLLPQGCGGKPCTVSSTSHSPSLYLEPVPIQPSLTWSHCVSFPLPYSPACDSSQFSPSSIFSPRTFFWIFHTSLQDEDKAGSLPHQLLLVALFLCWNVHSSSFCTEGAVAISMSCSHGIESPCL